MIFKLFFFSYLSAIQERKREKLLLQTVQEKSYHKVHGKVTAKALMDYGDNPLLLAIRVRKDYHCLSESRSSPVIPLDWIFRAFPAAKILFQT